MGVVLSFGVQERSKEDEKEKHIINVEKCSKYFWNFHELLLD